jgi:hypothetical protein
LNQLLNAEPLSEKVGSSPHKTKEQAGGHLSMLNKSILFLRVFV